MSRGANSPHDVVYSAEEFRHVFLNTIPVKALCERLICVESDMDASEARKLLQRRSFDVAGVSDNGKPPAKGYVKTDELRDGNCGKYLKEFTYHDLISDSTPVAKVFKILQNKSYVFVLENDEVNYILTRSDLEKPIARAYIFGLVSNLESFLTTLLVDLNEEVIEKILGNEKIKKARKLRQQAREENLDLSLIYYLSLPDKIKLLKKIRAKNPKEFDRNDESVRRARSWVDDVMKDLRKRGFHANKLYSILSRVAKIRNRIAHCQPISSEDFPLDKVAEIVSNLDDIMGIIGEVF
uniref:CBS domain-containing protein n=1 Tax=candidate division WOR-3 bacterium TaxID=2052148 RepID=A0A7C2P3N5_UNCW3